MDDFLNPSLKQIRRSILDIDDSYNNDWDILAELIQNAVDAIKKSSSTEIKKITLNVDASKKSISITDNGVGIDPKKLLDLLKPFSTDKVDDDETVGEKGVGLTFVMFSCNDFFIKSGNTNGTRSAIVKDAYNWKYSNDKKMLQSTFTDHNELFQGTIVNLNKIMDSPIFKLKYEQFKYILRTKTSFGNTKQIWEDDLNIIIKLIFKDQNGEEFEEEIPFKYWLIHEGLAGEDYIDLNDFINFIESGDRTDREKRKKLKNKIIIYKGEFEHSDNRKIKYFSCFVPKRRVWDDLSVDNGLITKEQLENPEYLSNFNYARFSNGIFTSVKGMPTGISIDHPNTGYAGYWSNIFILFEDNKLKFDIGRKSIHGSQSKILRDYAGKIFNIYLKYITKYVSGEVNQDTQWNKDEIFAEIDTMMDLESSNTKFIKNPKDQEASIAGMFFELIGKEKISNLIPLTTGYRNKYDLYAKWGNKKVVIEFKSKLKNILRDFNDEQKLFDEIDCIVCWNVDEEDEEALDYRGIDIDKVSYSRFDDTNNNFPHSTHVLTLSGLTSPVYVIDLKKVIE
ncbi:ATP-binding protein [Bacillus sp. AFS077874]|uniref:ATP-binding protein n=1 Tax=Bacillus sp. AFS077874 TaxID=2033513 RepID=UPI000BF403D8|nr:ATP-binding protein [Bacillus sp. AFS077874]PFM83138.1 ATP-binding protein [Bacillus sp. AFS077874]